MSIDKPNYDGFGEFIEHGNRKTRMCYAGIVLTAGYVERLANDTDQPPPPGAISHADSEDSRFGFGLGILPPKIDESNETISVGVRFYKVDKHKKEVILSHHLTYKIARELLMDPEYQNRVDDIIAGWQDCDEIDDRDWEEIATLFYHLISGEGKPDRTSRLVIQETFLEMASLDEIDSQAVTEIIMKDADKEKIPLAFFNFCERLIKRKSDRPWLSLTRKDEQDTIFWFDIGRVGPNAEPAQFFIIKTIVVAPNNNLIEVQIESSANGVKFFPAQIAGATKEQTQELYKTMIPTLTKAMMRGRKIEHEELPLRMRPLDWDDADPAIDPLEYTKDCKY